MSYDTTSHVSWNWLLWPQKHIIYVWVIILMPCKEFFYFWCWIFRNVLIKNLILETCLQNHETVVQHSFNQISHFVGSQYFHLSLSYVEFNDLNAIVEVAYIAEFIINNKIRNILLKWNDLFSIDNSDSILKFFKLLSFFFTIFALNLNDNVL